MTRFLASVSVAVVAALVAPPVPAHAQVPGGGPAKSDCYTEWTGITPNKGKNLDCQDGDPTCDVDQTQNGVCIIGIGVCLAQTNVPECTPQPVEKVTVKATPRTIKVGAINVPVTSPVPPPVPLSSPACGAETIFRLPLEGDDKGKQKPSKSVTLTAKAVTSGKPKKDGDTLKVRCVPNTGGGQCPDNPAGGPRELQLLAAASGTDLDNGWTGNAHGFPVVSNARLRVCLTGCGATSNPQCAEDEAQSTAVNAATFGAPLPLLTAGVPMCIVNRFAPATITGFTADLATGAAGGYREPALADLAELPDGVCPRCSGDAPGEAGTCDAGTRQDRACTTEGVVTVAKRPETDATRCRRTVRRAVRPRALSPSPSA